LSNATKELIGIMEHQAVGLLHDALSSSAQIAPLYQETLERTVSEEEFYSCAGSFLSAAIRSKAFTEGLAQSLPDGLSKVFRSQILGGLVRSPKVEFSNFGIFARCMSSDKIAVSFESGLGLDNRSIKQSATWSDKIHGLADQIATKEISAAHKSSAQQPATLYDIRRFSGPVPFLASLALEGAIRTIITSFMAHPSIQTIAMASESSKKPKKHRGKQLKDWFTLIAVPCALAAYHSWILAFAEALRKNSEVKIQGIGRFQLSKTGVTGNKVIFDPDDKLLKLLQANTSSTTHNSRHGSTQGGSRRKSADNIKIPA
jgi:hypothetical protein